MNIERLRKIALFFIIIFCCYICFDSSNTVGATGNNRTFTDIQKHWAEKSISTWAQRGYIDGYANGKFMPNQAITRAEFCVFINKLMGYKRVSSLRFSDLKGNEWYALEMGKAIAAGYLSGYPDGTIRPNQGITREEIASILTKVLSLKNVQTDTLSKFKDRDRISSWSKLSVNTVVYNKYMSGFPDKTFRPQSTVTRAEALAIFDRIVGTLYDTPGTYGLPYDTHNISGNVFINCGNVILRNVVISGDLYLTEGIGNGSVTLVNVKARSVKASGGVIINNCDLNYVLAETTNEQKLRLLAQGTTKIASVEARSSVLLEEANLAGTGFNNVLFNAPTGALVELDGVFRNVNVEAPKVRLDFLQGSIDHLNLSLAARDAEVYLDNDTVTKKLSIISKATIEGRGIINDAEVFGDGVIFDKAPQKIKVATGVKAKVNGRTITGTNTYSSGDYYKRTAPVFVKNYPDVTDVHSRGFDLLLKADESCRAYYVVLYADERVPSADKVMAGQNASGRTVPSNRRGNVSLTANRERSVAIDDLSPDEEYHVYIVLSNSGVGIDPPVIRVKVTTEDSSYGNLSGTVTTTKGSVLKNVKVSVFKGTTLIDSTKTDAAGEYTIYDLEPGTYNLLFSKSGYEDERITKVTLSAGRTKYVDSSLKLK